MIYNESGNIILLFESEKFEFSNNPDSKKIEDLENKIKQEFDELQSITSEIKNPNLNIGDKCVKLKKRVKLLSKINMLFAVTPLAGIAGMLIGFFKGKEIIALLSGAGGLTIGMVGAIKSIKDYSKYNNEIIKAYEEDISLSLSILEKLDKMNLKDEDKKKVKEAIEKIKSTMNDIDEIKKVFDNEQKIADQIADKYNLKNRFEKASYDDLLSIGVVLSCSNDDDFTYITAVVSGYGLSVHCDLGLTKSNLDSNPPKVKVLDYKKLSDSWGGDYNWNDYSNKYVIIKCEKTNYKFKKGQIFKSYC